MDEERPPESTVYNLVVGALYVLAVGVQVYYVVDHLTDGALTEQVNTKARELTARLRARRNLERAYREQLPWVRWSIHQMENEANQP